MCDELERDLQRWGEAERAKAAQVDGEVASAFQAVVRRRQAERLGPRPTMRLWGAGAALAALLLLAIWLAPRSSVDGPGVPRRGQDALTHGGARLTMLQMRHAALRGDAQLRLPPASSVSWMADPSVALRQSPGEG
jgi:hypothetical protein